MTTPTDEERATLRSVLRNTPQALAGHCVLEDVGDCPDCSDAILGLLAGLREAACAAVCQQCRKGPPTLVENGWHWHVAEASRRGCAATAIRDLPLLPPPEHP